MDLDEGDEVAGIAIMNDEDVNVEQNENGDSSVSDQNGNK